MRIALAVAALLFALALAGSASAAYSSPCEDLRDRSEPARFAVPLRGPLFEPFGYGRGRLHAGIDIAVLGTDVVRAALPGRVTAVGYLPNGYGNVVRLRHEDGIETMYAHLAEASVREGQRVEGGQLIARAGCTGSCTGAHVHFEVRVRGKLVDPLGFLRGRVR